MTATHFAIIYSILMCIVIIFQGCLALGVPWGAASMGGKYPGKYPPRMRIVAVINMLILTLLLLIVLIRAELIWPSLFSFSTYTIWLVVAFSAVGVVLNTITPSKLERMWAPLLAIQLVSSIVIALS